MTRFSWGYLVLACSKIIDGALPRLFNSPTIHQNIFPGSHKTLSGYQRTMVSSHSALSLLDGPPRISSHTHQSISLLANLRQSQRARLLFHRWLKRSSSSSIYGLWMISCFNKISGDSKGSEWSHHARESV